MRFQPFGYRFEIVSSMRPVDAKAAMRSGMTGWFETKNGPRGWIVGPFFCLWRRAFDQYGPMVLGRISHDNFGTRVVGRAGSDLNGVLMFSLLVPLVAFLVFMPISQGSASAGQLMLLAGVFLIGGPLVYWSAHKDRRQAEPLVNFIRRELGAVRPAPPRVPIHPGPYQAMGLNVSGKLIADKATPEAIRNAVESIAEDEDEFVILEQEDEVYMQVAYPDGEFIVEKRAGNEQTHFRAYKEEGDPFTGEEIVEMLIGYLAGAPDAPGVQWEPTYR